MINKDCIFIKQVNRISKIYYKNITHIEADKDYCLIYTMDSKLTYHIHTTLDSFIRHLPNNFYRCHRSYIVNINNISSITDNEINSGEHIVPLSNGYRKEFLEKINYIPTTSELKNEKNG